MEHLILESNSAMAQKELSCHVSPKTPDAIWHEKTEKTDTVCDRCRSVMGADLFSWCFNDDGVRLKKLVLGKMRPLEIGRWILANVSGARCSCPAMLPCALDCVLSEVQKRSIKWGSTV